MPSLPLDPCERCATRWECQEGRLDCWLFGTSLDAEDVVSKSDVWNRVGPQPWPRFAKRVGPWRDCHFINLTEFVYKDTETFPCRIPNVEGKKRHIVFLLAIIDSIHNFNAKVQRGIQLIASLLECFFPICNGSQGNSQLLRKIWIDVFQHLVRLVPYHAGL